MGEVFTATSKSADAPNLEAQMYDATFLGTSRKFVKGGQFAKDLVNGDERLEWAFELQDDNGAPLYDDNKPDPIVLTKLTGLRFNVTSSTVPGEVKALKALMTAAEFNAFKDGLGSVPEEELIGRPVQLEVFIKDNGWPTIGNIIAARRRTAAR